MTDRYHVSLTGEFFIDVESIEEGPDEEVPDHPEEEPDAPPAPDEPPETDTPPDPHEDVDPTLTIERDGETVVGQRPDGDAEWRGTAEEVFGKVCKATRDDDIVHIGEGEFVLSSGKVVTEVQNLAWLSDGTVRLDDNDTRQTHLFRFQDCRDVLIDGGTYDFDQANNVDDGNAGTQCIIQLRCHNVEIRNTRLLNAVNAFVMDGFENIHIHHNEMVGSEERGIYMSNCNNVEFDHNTVRDVVSGIFRTRRPDGKRPIKNLHSHDNDLATREGVFGPVYLITDGVENVRIERDEALLRGTGCVYWDRFASRGINWLSIRNCSFSADEPPRNLFHISAPEGETPDVRGLNVDGLTLDGVVDNTAAIKAGQWSA